MAAVTETFCIYHVTAPGMEPGADELPDDFTYPTMDQLSEQVRQLDTLCRGFYESNLIYP